MSIKIFLNNTIKFLTGYIFVNAKSYYNYKLTFKKTRFLGIISSFNNESDFQNRLIKNIKHSKSGEQQDIFVLSVLNEKKFGVFVEFGVMDGITGSNTYLLEKFYGWNGLLIEPSKQFSKYLLKNRNCKLDFRCIHVNDNDKIIFNEISKSGLSTIDKYSLRDKHFKLRKSGKKYEIETIKLETALEENLMPYEIDYMSIDTEGSEFEIIKDFNFNKYLIKIITIEHNYDIIKRKSIYDLLTKNNFYRVLENFSDNDDWYIHKTLNVSKI